MATLPWSAAQAATTGRLRDGEQLEADVRKLMARHAATKARGWDGQRDRARLHAEIDVLLDDWLIVAGLAGL